MLHHFSFLYGIIILQERCIVKKKTYICDVRPEKWLDIQESVFCFIRNIEIANFQLKDRDNSNAHSVYMYIMLKRQPMLYPYSLYIFQCENIVSSFISVRRLAMPDVWWAGQVSHFLYCYTLKIASWLRGLIDLLLIVYEKISSNPILGRSFRTFVVCLPVGGWYRRNLEQHR